MLFKVSFMLPNGIENDIYEIIRNNPINFHREGLKKSIYCTLLTQSLGLGRVKEKRLMKTLMVIIMYH